MRVVVNTAKNLALILVLIGQHGGCHGAIRVENIPHHFSSLSVDMLTRGSYINSPLSYRLYIFFSLTTKLDCYLVLPRSSLIIKNFFDDQQHGACRCCRYGDFPRRDSTRSIEVSLLEGSEGKWYPANTKFYCWR